MNVLVTGSSRGIGREIILAYAKAGYDVVINYKDSESKALELKKYVEDTYNVKALAIKCDIKNESDIDNMLSIINDEFSSLDVLINNAAIALDQDFFLKTKEEFMSVLETNLVGSYLLAKKVGAKMFDRKCGCIINISSTNGIDTYYPESIDYDASKAGLISLSHNLAHVFAPYVRVNTICPGWVDTDMNSKLDADFKMREERKILLQRFATADEIAALAYFLGSDKASYINDSVIRIDGGVCHV